jgi:hypothetical protein
MQFNTLIKTQISPILRKHGYRLSEEFENIIGFKSLSMRLNFAYNAYDRTFLVEIGRQGNYLNTLDDNAVKGIFGFELPIEQVTMEDFVRNLSVLFEQPQVVKLLEGNVSPLEKFSAQASSDYTASLVRSQLLEDISRAWDDKNYGEFIRIVDKIGLDDLPGSYLLKYKIAKRKFVQI